MYINTRLLKQIQKNDLIIKINVLFILLLYTFFSFYFKYFILTDLFDWQ